MDAPMDALQPHIDVARRAHDYEIAPDFDPRTERARLMAAENIRTRPETRKLMEDVYGKTYCQFRYPEAYTK